MKHLEIRVTRNPGDEEWIRSPIAFTSSYSTDYNIVGLMAGFKGLLQSKQRRQLHAANIALLFSNVCE